MNPMLKILYSSFLITMLIACGDSSNQETKKENEETTLSYTSLLVCSVECSDKIEQKGTHNHNSFDGKSFDVKVGGTKSTEEFYDGDKSVLLKSKKKFGLRTFLKKVKTGEKYRASVWRKNEDQLAALVVQSTSAKKFYKTSKKAIETKENGWQKLSIEFEVQKGVTELKIYAFLAKSTSAYFDHLEIEQLQ